VDLRPCTQLYVIWLINYLLRAAQVRLGRSGQPTSSGVQTLKTRFNRAYDRQRALCEDPVLIRRWFELVEQTKAKYGILDEDVHNFDEAGFMMGKITT
jgi:hypothetical protein